MNLIKLCDPIFQYICFLERNSDNEEILFNKAVEDIASILESLNEAMTNNSTLSRQFKRVRLSLLFFIDSTICESGISFSAEWDKNRLAYREDELTGDRKFFNELEEVLHEYTLDADECLKIYYICLGLGYKGAYFDRPDKLEEFMQRIKHRIGSFISNTEIVEILKNESSGSDTRNLVSTTYFTRRNALLFLIILFTLWFAVNSFLYYKSVGHLSHNLRILNSHLDNRIKEGI
jgi:type IV/VI secretion system ImpK/VasF family protein